MRAKKALTDRGIRALPSAAKGKRRLVWDALVPGLAVRVTDKGQRSFVLVTRYPGSRHPAILHRARWAPLARLPLKMLEPKPAAGTSSSRQGPILRRHKPPLRRIRCMQSARVPCA
jgi:hypothetical protein